jgi:hypothetical protein
MFDRIFEIQKLSKTKNIVKIEKISLDIIIKLLLNTPF